VTPYRLISRQSLTPYGLFLNVDAWGIEPPVRSSSLWIFQTVEPICAHNRRLLVHRDVIWGGSPLRATVPREMRQPPSSGRRELNSRPPGPKPGALPSCATSRGTTSAQYPFTAVVYRAALTFCHYDRIPLRMQGLLRYGGVRSEGVEPSTSKLRVSCSAN
jgi:hypothetical protein